MRNTSANNTTPANIVNKGRWFEDKVKNILIRNNYVLIDNNKWIRNYAFEKDRARKREYDLVMFNTMEKEFYVIECKSHFSKDKTVSLGQVKKFNYVANNYGARKARKMIVTDTDLSASAKRYAERNNILFINGDGLGRMDKKPSTPYNPGINRMIRVGLENIVKSLIRSYLG